MIRHLKHMAAIAGAMAIMVGTGCGENALTSTGSFSSLDEAAEATATLTANSIDAELLVLADDIEEVSTTGELPSERPRPRIDRLQEALGLSDDQVTQIEAIMDASRALRDPIIEQVRGGSLTREEARTQMQAIREDTKSQIEALLTADQLTAFEELRENHGRQFNRRSLSEFLNLTEDQQTQLESVMQGLREQIVAIREQVESEELTREEARTLIQEIRETELDQLSGILDEEQLSQFQRILNHRRFGFGPRGFGRGPRGDFRRPGLA